ncbi:hypothetical protein BJ165DRAFT_1405616 [Panaeolus papilionaceus]|nr:hypothetical protein BJ165DRAFT_1405616 [Panaeolus papilionaceus]
MCAEIFSGILNSRMRGREASEECGDWDCQKFGEFGGMCVDVKLERNEDGRDMMYFAGIVTFIDSGEVGIACNMASAPRFIQVPDHYTGRVPAVLVLHKGDPAAATSIRLSVEEIRTLGCAQEHPIRLQLECGGDNSAPLEIICFSFVRLGCDEGV